MVIYLFVFFIETNNLLLFCLFVFRERAKEIHVNLTSRDRRHTFKHNFILMIIESEMYYYKSIIRIGEVHNNYIDINYRSPINTCFSLVTLLYYRLGWGKRVLSRVEERNKYFYIASWNRVKFKVFIPTSINF